MYRLAGGQCGAGAGPDCYQLEQAGAGSYLSAETLPEGRWIARVSIAVGDQRWMDEAEVQ